MCITVILVPFLLGTSTAIFLSKGQDLSALVKVSDHFAIKIHRKIAPEGVGNIVTSPLALSINSAIHCNGQKDKTAEEIRTALERISEDSKANGYLLYIATAVFVQKGSHILPEFQNGALQNYNAIIHEVDFHNDGGEAVTAINDWVKSQTNNKIEKMLDNVDPDTNEIFLNAVYFKETWNTAFDPKHTTTEVFYNNGLESKQTKVEMMHLVAELSYLRIPGGQMFELPYKGEQHFMLVLLPDDMKAAYEFEFLYAPTEAITVLTKCGEKAYVDLSFPKFKFEYQTDLSSENTMNILFRNNSCQRSLSIVDPIPKSRLVHKVVFEVDEEGSEISGESGNIGKKSPVIKVVADHPFLFAIYNKVGETYLMGRISQL